VSAASAAVRSRYASTSCRADRTIGSRLTYIHDYIADPSDRPSFEQQVRARFGPALTALGLPGSANDDDERQSRRASLLLLVGVTANDADVRRTARGLAEKYIENPSALPPTLAPSVLNVAAAAGDAALYERYMAQIQKLAGNPETYYRFFNGLAWFTDPALIRRTLDFTLTPAARSQDAGLLLAGMMGKPASRDLTWAFVKAQWTALVNKLGTFQGVPNIVAATGNFCTLEAAADVRHFFTQNPIPSTARALQQSLERIESCAAMDQRQSAPLSRWLANAR
jgi:aminopeptidase N